MAWLLGLKIATASSVEALVLGFLSYGLSIGLYIGAAQGIGATRVATGATLVDPGYTYWYNESKINLILFKF